MRLARAQKAHIDPVSDRDLLAGCIRNDRDAWRELMDRYEDGLRVKVFRRCEPFLNVIPSDYQDDFMGAFYLRLLESDKNALRGFDFQKGTALFKWFTRLVRQCAREYLSAELSHGAGRASVTDALSLADEGGVLSSGARPVLGSLSARVRADKAQSEKRAYRARRKDRRRRRRAARLALSV